MVDAIMLQCSRRIQLRISPVVIYYNQFFFSILTKISPPIKVSLTCLCPYKPSKWAIWYGHYYMEVIWYGPYHMIYFIWTPSGCWKPTFKASMWKYYVFGLMSHSTFVILLSPQAKWYVLIWFQYLNPLTCLKFWLKNDSNCYGM